MGYPKKVAVSVLAFFCLLGAACNKAPFRATVPAKGEFVYVVSIDDTSLYQFHINDDGTLQPLSPISVPLRVSQDQVLAIACTARNKYVYVLSNPIEAGADHVEPDDIQSYVSVLKIAADGQLEAPKIALVLPNEVDDFCISPNGNFAYLATGNRNTTDNREIQEYALTSDGSLNLIGNIEVKGDNNDKLDLSLTLVNKGHRLYCATSQGLLGFGVKTDGTLKALSPGWMDKGKLNPIVFRPDERFAYCSDEDANVRQYRVERNGSLVRQNLQSHVFGYFLTADPKRQYLYAGQTDPISVIKIRANGGLTDLKAGSLAGPKGLEAAYNTSGLRFNDTDQFAYCSTSSPPDNHGFTQGYIWQYKRNRKGLLEPNHPFKIQAGHLPFAMTFAKL